MKLYADTSWLYLYVPSPQFIIIQYIWRPDGDVQQQRKHKIEANPTQATSKKNEKNNFLGEWWPITALCGAACHINHFYCRCASTVVSADSSFGYFWLLACFYWWRFFFFATYASPYRSAIYQHSRLIRRPAAPSTLLGGAHRNGVLSSISGWIRQRKPRNP